MIANDGHVVRHGPYGLVRKLHQHLVGGPAAAPGIPKALPVVSSFMLIAVPPALLEQAVLIPDAVTVQRQIVGGGGVQEAGGETPQTAVAQGAVLDLLEHVDIQPVLGESRLHLVQKPQVIQVIIDHAACKILGGEIVSAPAPLMHMTALIPGVGDAVHDQLAQGVVDLIYGGLVGRHLMILFQSQLYLLENLIHVKPFLNMGPFAQYGGIIPYPALQCNRKVQPWRHIPAGSAFWGLTFGTVFPAGPRPRT